jgi:iron complex transport system permease protein
MLVEKRVAAFARPPDHPWRRRRIAVLTASAAFLAGAALLGIAHGTVSIPPGDVVAMLAGGGSPEDRAILWNLRLPRVLVGTLVGTGLALAGAVLQGVLRNPLADPGIMGVSAGAGLVVAADTAARIVATPLELPVGSILALLGAPYFLYLLRRGGRWR